jgi:voltage-gated potassium channel Kch
VFAAFIPGDIVGEMTSIGTLFAFMLVCAGVWIARGARTFRGFTVPRRLRWRRSASSLRGDDLRPRLDQLAAADRLAGDRLDLHFGYGQKHSRRRCLTRALARTAVGVDRARRAAHPPRHRDGTLGYALIEGWSLWDAFYMTIITITTVGYFEVHPLSRAGQAFTVAIILTGVGAFFYAFTLFMALLASGTLQERRERKRLARMLDNLTDHFILCGLGRLGEIISREFARQHVPFVVIERNPERVPLRTIVTRPPRPTPRTKTSCGVRIDRARPGRGGRTDAENVYAVLSAPLARPVHRRTPRPRRATKLTRAGANRVISPHTSAACNSRRRRSGRQVGLCNWRPRPSMEPNLSRCTWRRPRRRGTPARRGLRQRFGVVWWAPPRRRQDGLQPRARNGDPEGDDLLCPARSRDLEAAAMKA